MRRIVPTALFALVLAACGARPAATPPPPTASPAPAPALLTLPSAAPTPPATATLPPVIATSLSLAGLRPEELPTPDAEGRIYIPFPTIDPQMMPSPVLPPDDYDAWPPVESVQQAIDALQQRSGHTFTVVQAPLKENGIASETARLELLVDGQTYQVLIERYPDLQTADAMYEFWFSMALKDYCSVFRSANGMISVSVEPKLPNPLHYAMMWPLEAE